MVSSVISSDTSQLEDAGFDIFCLEFDLLSLCLSGFFRFPPTIKNTHIY